LGRTRASAAVSFGTQKGCRVLELVCNPAEQPPARPHLARQTAGPVVNSRLFLRLARCDSVTIPVAGWQLDTLGERRMRHAVPAEAASIRGARAFRTCTRVDLRLSASGVETVIAAGANIRQLGPMGVPSGGHGADARSATGVRSAMVGPVFFPY